MTCKLCGSESETPICEDCMQNDTVEVEVEELGELFERVSQLEHLTKALSSRIKTTEACLNDDKELDNYDKERGFHDVSKELEQIREENEKLKKRVGLSEDENNAIREDIPQLMRYAEFPQKDRESRLTANQQRAVDVWTVWDIYADKSGKAETLAFSEIRKVLRSREEVDVTYQTVKRVADFMVRLSEGMLEVDDLPDESGKRLKRVLSVDEWRRDHFRRKKEEREQRKAELRAEAEEDIEAMESALSD